MTQFAGWLSSHTAALSLLGAAVAFVWSTMQQIAQRKARHFPLYYEFMERMLAGLKRKWAADPDFQWPRLIEEIDLTLKHIQQSK